MSNILIAGGSGLVGTRLSQLLTEKNHTVFHLSRKAKNDSLYRTFQWNIKNDYIDQEAIQLADYVINLAGAGIADQKWTESRKALIISSRVNSTHLLRRALMQKDNPPKAYISASAIGYYGDRGDELLVESDLPGDGFLSESCQLWEAAVADIAALGWRTVVCRIGLVLSTQGGALPKMLLPARLHVGTYFGDGRQYYSWIHIDDLCGIFIKAVEDDQMAGVFNAVGPQPVRNKQFVETLSQALDTSAIQVPAPKFALRMAMGEMADVVLSGSKVSSAKIEKQGFTFSHPTLEGAFRNVIETKV